MPSTGSGTRARRGLRRRYLGLASIDVVDVRRKLTLHGETESLVPIRELARWAEKRSQDEGGFDRDILVVGDMNIPSRGSELFNTVRRYGLKHAESLSKKGRTEAGANLSRRASYDQILHRASNPGRFTDEGGVVDFFMGDYSALYPEIDSLHKFTFEMSDHLSLWIQLDTWIEHEQLDSMLDRLSGG